MFWDIEKVCSRWGLDIQLVPSGELDDLAIEKLWFLKIVISDGHNVESQRLMILMLSPQSATFDSQKRWFVYITI